MAIILAAAETPAGHAARDFAVQEARRRDTDLVVFPVDGNEPDLSAIPYERVSVEHAAARSRNAVGDLVDATNRAEIDAVVVGVRRRSPAGKVLLGSSGQQIILESAVPVIAVKPAPGR